MPREPRKNSVTGYYHVILRGVNRQDIFYDDEDRHSMLYCLKRYATEIGITITAYCLMNNHIHLLINASEGIDLFVKKIAASFVFHFNRKYGRIGHLFQDRFLSEPVETEHSLLIVFRYILQNPQKAGICSVEEYKWSSWREINGFSGICQMNEVIEMGGGTNALKTFVLAKNDDKCLESNNSARLSEDEALQMAIRLLGENPQRVAFYPKERRDLALRQMHAAGVSVRMISRLTGLGRRLIQRAIETS